MSHEVRRGETLTLSATYDDGTNPVDPVNPRVRITNHAGAIVVDDVVPVHDDVGEFHYDFTPAIDAPLGDYLIRWSGTIDGVLEYSEEDFEVVGIFGGGTGDEGPCQPWATADDALSYGYDAPDNMEAFEAMLEAASGVLFDLSGRRYAGECETTRTIEGKGPNVCAVKRVAIGAVPVREVTSVTITHIDEPDEVIDSTQYYVEGGKWLVREDEPNGGNKGWPLDGSLVVDFTYGQSPPNIGKMAAVELAAELLLARTDPDKCRLPRRVTNVVRQGVSISFAEAGDFSDLPTVKLFLDASNPTGRRRRAGVLNPDLVTTARQRTG